MMRSGDLHNNNSIISTRGYKHTYTCSTYIYILLYRWKVFSFLKFSKKIKKLSPENVNGKSQNVRDRAIEVLPNTLRGQELA